jgi:iron complex transport system substrate-binding protein
MEIGKLTGKQKLAQDIANKQQQRLVNIKQKIPKGAHPKIFMEIGAKPIFTVLPNTFMDDFITCCGGQNIASDLTMGTITRESVLLRNPDVIIIVSMGVTATEEKTNWAEYKNLSATKKGKIFMVDSNQCCVPTPTDFADVVELLIKLIYN